MAKQNGTKSRPVWIRTGLSRSILLTLERGEATIEEVLERLGPREKTITPGAVWVILERAIRNGLVRSDRRENPKPYHYRLTDGGIRRIKWIKSKFKRALKPVELRVAANPVEEEE
jgi:DNA-binding PadR family transcriptional regulator